MAALRREAGEGRGGAAAPPPSDCAGHARKLEVGKEGNLQLLQLQAGKQAGRQAALLLFAFWQLDGRTGGRKEPIHLLALPLLLAAAAHSSARRETSKNTQLYRLHHRQSVRQADRPTLRPMTAWQASKQASCSALS